VGDRCSPKNHNYEGDALKVFSQLEPHLRRSLLTLFVAGLLFWSSIAALLPTLPLYIQSVGGNSQQIGVVMGSFAIGLLLFRPMLGRMADDRSRKLVLLIGIAVVAIAPLGYVFITSIPLLMVLRAFHGISVAAFTTGFSALVADLSPPSQRGELIGYMSLVNPLGVAIGPALGGFIQAGYGYSPLFITSFALGMVGLFCATQITEVKREPKDSHPSVSPQQQPSFWGLLLTDRLRIPFVVMLMIGLVFGIISTFIPLFIQESKIDLNSGLFYSTAAVSSFSVRLVTGRASDRYGRGLFITASLVCYMIAMIVLGFAHSPNSVLVAAAIEGAGAGTLIPMMVALMADRSLVKERGQVFSLCIGGFDIGIALAGPILGSFADLLGYRTLFAIAAGLAITALIVFLTLSSKDLRHSFKFALGREKDIYALSE
jgi:MFS family permease